MAMTPIATLFAKSPFQPLQQHMRAVLECARDVMPLIEAVCVGDRKRVKTSKEQIFQKEATADEMMHQLRARLPKSLFLPVDRRDLLELLQMQDGIADTAQDIAGMLSHRRMELPQSLHEPVKNLTRRCLDVCEQAGKVIEQVDELVETGFKGREVKRVAGMIDELSRTEDETDTLGLDLTHSLFDQGENMNPVAVIMWHQVIQQIGDLADYAESVGQRLRILLGR